MTAQNKSAMEAAWERCRDKFTNMMLADPTLKIDREEFAFVEGYESATNDWVYCKPPEVEKEYTVTIVSSKHIFQQPYILLDVEFFAGEWMNLNPYETVIAWRERLLPAPLPEPAKMEGDSENN